MKKDKQTLEKELEKAKEILALGYMDKKAGEEVALSMKDGCTYFGTILGQTMDNLYLKDVNIVAAKFPIGLFKEYVRLSLDDICAQYYVKKNEKEKNKNTGR